MDSFYRFSNFLSQDHCNRLIERAKNSSLFKQDSTISGDGVEKGSYRTSRSFTLIDRKLMETLSDSLNLEKDKLERPLLIKYKQGEEFKPHVDFHIEGTLDYESRVRNGQRTLSFIFYLNDDYKNGELHFDKLGETLKAEAGELIVIVNQFLNGKMNWNSSHCSLPVKRGSKYILLINYTGKYQKKSLAKKIKS